MIVALVILAVLAAAITAAVLVGGKLIEREFQQYDGWHGHLP